MVQKQKQKQKTSTKTSSKTGKKTSTRSDIVLEEITTLEASTESEYVRLAGLLSEAFHKEYYSLPAWGSHPDFKTFASVSLRVGRRKAYHLVEIYDKIKGLKLDLDKVSEIGWTKMREIVGVMDADNAEDLMESAATLSHRDLVDKVKVMKSASGAASRQSRTTLKVVGDETMLSPVIDAIETAKLMLNTTDSALAMQHICQDWLMSQGQSGTKTTVESYIKHVERVYGVNLVVAGEQSMDSAVGTKTPEKPPEIADTLESDESNEIHASPDINSVASEYALMDINSLRRLAKERKLSSKGKKADIIERLEKADAKDAAPAGPKKEKGAGKKKSGTRKTKKSESSEDPDTPDGPAIPGEPEVQSADDLVGKGESIDSLLGLD